MPLNFSSVALHVTAFTGPLKPALLVLTCTLLLWQPSMRPSFWCPMFVQDPGHLFHGWASEELVPFKKEGAVKKENVLLMDSAWLSVQTYTK